ncbi:MAG: phosphotransferase [Rhizobiaceae bacterium]|nr:phosphotransferase [Rhizobiaceae bacterium]
MLDFRPSYSTPDVSAVELFIEKHYALGGKVSCRLLRRGLNDVYLVEADKGGRYVFRISHHRARGPADVKTETSFLMHLSASGVPVAEPVPTRDGTLFVHGLSPEGQRPAVLFDAIGGREPYPTGLADAAANGRTLALLHNAAETFSSDGALYRLDLEHLLHRPMARIRNSRIVENAGILGEFERIAERTSQTLLAFGNLSCTYCHGDCHGFNSRINDAGDAVFFDFDDSGPGYLAYDLSVFLWGNVSFGRRLTPAWDAFLRGYRAVRPITAHDFEATMWFVVVRHFWLMGEYASRTQEWGSETVSWIAHQTEFLNNWEREQLTGRLF